MKETVFETPQYHIAIDKEKNRAYLTIIGFWRDPAQVAQYVPDFEKAVTKLKRGYTLLTDLRQMKTHPQAVQQVHMDAQAMLIRTGLKHTAEVLESAIVQFQTQKLSSESKMPLTQHKSIEEAEEHLDSL